MLSRIFIVVGGLLAVALFVALIGPYFIDWTGFRQDFENQASRIIGKKVVVHGTVDARLLPFPSVTMTDVRIGEAENGEALVTAESFSMESELAPFLSGQARIYNMRIEQPKLRLELGEDGSLDWVRTGTPQIPASSVTLENVSVTGGEILFIDRQTGRNRHVTGLNLNVSARTLAGPWSVNGTGAIDGKTGRFVLNTGIPEAGKLLVKLRLSPDDPAVVADLDGTLALAGDRPQYVGKFRLRGQSRSEGAATGEETAERKSASPRVSGDFELMNDRLRIPAYEFRVGDPDDPYIVTGEATIDAGRAPQFLLTAEGHQIDLSQFGQQSDGTTDAQPVAFADRVRALLTIAADIPIPALPGEARIRLPGLVTNGTTIRDITLTMHPDTDGWLIDKAEAQLPGRTTLSAAGRLALGETKSFTGDLLIASQQPSGFADWVTGDVPESIRKLKTAGFSAKVDLTPDLQRFEDLEIVMGTANLRGRLERQIAEDGMPALSVDLKGNDFDLDTIRALGGLMTGEKYTGTLLGHRIAAKLKIDHFSAFGLEASGLDTAFSLSEGAISELRLDLADFYGATIRSTGGIASLAGTPKGEAQIAFRSADPKAFLALLQSRIRAHPALARLVANASYFTDSDMNLKLRLGLGDWPVEASLEGKTRGTQVTAKLAAQTLNLADSGGLSLDATLENPEAWILLGQLGLPTMPFDADEDSRIVLKLAQAPESEPQVTVAYTSSTTSLSIEGQAALDAARFLEGSYTIELDSGDLAPYLLMTGLTPPRIAEGLPASLTANVYVQPDGVGVENLDSDFDGNKIAGVLSIDRRTAKPTFAGELTAGALDLAWLSETVFGQVVDPLSGGLSTTPFLKNQTLPFNTDLALSSDTLHLGTVGDVTAFRTRLAFRDGRITLSDASGKFSAGTFSGRAEFGNTEGNGFFRSRIDIRQARLSTALWPVADKPAVQATADLSLVLDASGTSTANMLNNATGSGTLTLGKATINGLNGKLLPTLLAFADATTGDVTDAKLRAEVDKSLFKGSVTLDRIELPFALAAGKFRATDLHGGNEDLSFGGEADLAIDPATIDANLALTYAAGDNALAGADPTIALHWKGALSSPERRIDLTAMTGFLSLRKFEQERRRVEILQQNIAEKQRLRREAALYRARNAERQRLKLEAEAAEKARQEAEALKRQQELEAKDPAAPAANQDSIDPGIEKPPLEQPAQ
ncbi:MAG: hypothetical protein RLZZ444_2525 [Pseudomonadota bacterium]